MEYIKVIDVNRKIQDSYPDYEKYKSTGRFVYKSYSNNEIENYESEYYSENIYRLKEIKMKYDPQDMFNFQQGIRGN